MDLHGYLVSEKTVLWFLVGDLGKCTRSTGYSMFGNTDNFSSHCQEPGKSMGKRIVCVIKGT